jgi:hypothetical protein
VSARVAYFTAGTVGAGHFVRGAAIARALRRAGAAVAYRMFGPPLDFPAVRGHEYRPIAIDAAALIDPARAKESALAAALADFAPDLLLIDLFWAPLRHILPLAGCEAWLLLRKTPPEWFRGPARAPFEPRQFARMIAIEPIESPAKDRIDPIVIANREEMKPRGALRAKLGVAEDERLTAIVHAGKQDELAALRGEGRVFDLRNEHALFPLAEWIDDADTIISAAGYNTFWEARWLGYATKMRLVPLARRIDDQAWRAQLASSITLRENGADTLARWICA